MKESFASTIDIRGQINKGEKSGSESTLGDFLGFIKPSQIIPGKINI